MEVPELSLATRQLVPTKSTNSLESESNFSKKRKLFQDHNLHNAVSQTSSLDLQLNDPLPLDWEQCLDLESGKMYYLNRKTLSKSWNFPVDEKTLDLELNISASSFSDCSKKFNGSFINNRNIEEMNKKITIQTSQSNHVTSTSSQRSTGNMVALACLNCHLLVILSKSSPSCPNCKYVHSLPTQQITTSPSQVSNNDNDKSLGTLSLLN